MSRHQYLLISRGQWDERAGKDEVQAAIDTFYDWYEQGLARGILMPGSRLENRGKRVSGNGITDGPFAETKELIGGYWFIVAETLDEAAAIAAENPCIRYGLEMEIRPLDPERASASATSNETPPGWRKVPP